MNSGNADETVITLKSQKMEDVRIITFTVDKMLEEQVIQQAGEDLMEVVASAEQGEKIVLTFRGVSFMSSAMLGKLILFHKKCKAAGITLKVCNIAPDLMEVFKITRLDKLFDLHKDEKAALKSFAKKGWFK